MIRNSSSVCYKKIDQGKDISTFHLRRKGETFVTNFDFVFLALVLTLTYAIYKGVTSWDGCNIYYWTFFVCFYLLRLFWRASCVKEEKLTVIRGLGVQITSHFWSGKEKSLFIDKNRINAVVINEGFRFYNVITYLAFIVEGENHLVTAFDHIFPRMNVILEIYHATQSLLHDPDLKQ